MTIHKEIQKKLLTLIPGVKLEYAFPEKGRIADVFWEEERLIFEIQCSPLSLEEAKARNEDYKELGIQVIWILHDKRFNRRFPTSAEIYLREGLAYFSNHNAQGKGFFYDQEERLSGRKRLFRKAPIPIYLDRPKEIQERKVLSSKNKWVNPYKKLLLSFVKKASE